MSSVGDQIYNGNLIVSGNTSFTTSADESTVTLNQGVTGTGQLVGGTNSVNSIYFTGTYDSMPTVNYTNEAHTAGSIGSSIFFTNFNIFMVLPPPVITPVIPPVMTPVITQVITPVITTEYQFNPVPSNNNSTIYLTANQIQKRFFQHAHQAITMPLILQSNHFLPCKILKI